MTDTATYAWLITHDYIDADLVGTAGPRGITNDQELALQEGDGTPFRMFDDDGAMYAQGLYLGPDDERMFAPLDGFGTPSLGCTEIQYVGPKGWETL